MEINADISSVPLSLQAVQAENRTPEAVAESLVRGAPLGVDLGTSTSAASVIDISEEATSLATEREEVEAEEARHGDRSILGGVDEQAATAADTAQNRVNMPLDGSSLVPETLFEREASELILEANERNQDIALAQKTKVVANEDMADVLTAMQAAAFQIPPEVNGTLTPQPTGNLSEQDDPSATPVDPSLSSAEGSVANSVMGMESPAGMQNNFLDQSSASLELEDQRGMFSYGADGEGGRGVETSEANILAQTA